MLREQQNRYREDLRFFEYYLWGGFIILSIVYQTSDRVWSSLPHTFAMRCAVELSVALYCYAVFRIVRVCLALLHAGIHHGWKEGVMKLMGIYRRRFVGEMRLFALFGIPFYTFMSLLFWYLNLFFNMVRITVTKVLMVQLGLLLACLIVVTLVITQEYIKAYRAQRRSSHQQTH